jgi:hypothetical protein
MHHFPTTETTEEALIQASRARRDDLGYCYHTFRITLPEGKLEWPAVLSALVDHGWQLQGTPVVVDATDAVPRHVILSMLHAEPRPIEIRGELRIRGEINGAGEIRGGTT